LLLHLEEIVVAGSKFVGAHDAERQREEVTLIEFMPVLTNWIQLVQFGRFKIRREE
jgi:hypothetical protein